MILLFFRGKTEIKTHFFKSRRRVYLVVKPIKFQTISVIVILFIC